MMTPSEETQIKARNKVWTTIFRMSQTIVAGIVIYGLCYIASEIHGSINSQVKMSQVLCQIQATLSDIGDEVRKDHDRLTTLEVRFGDHFDLDKKRTR